MLPVIVDSRIKSYLVCRGLFHDHRSFYCDISPANILWHGSNSILTVYVQECLQMPKAEIQTKDWDSIVCN